MAEFLAGLIDPLLFQGVFGGTIAFVEDAEDTCSPNRANFSLVENPPDR